MAFTALAAIVLIVTALMLFTGQPKAAIVTTRATGAHAQASAGALLGPVATRRHVMPLGNPSAPIEWILLVFALVALGFAAWLWSSRGHSRPPGVPA